MAKCDEGVGMDGPMCGGKALDNAVREDVEDDHSFASSPAMAAACSLVICMGVRLVLRL